MLIDWGIALLQDIGFKCNQLRISVLQFLKAAHEMQGLNQFIHIFHIFFKDNKEAKSKSGCGRVVVGKDLQIVHSYTFECGYHSAVQIKPIIDLNTFCYNATWKFNQNQISDHRSKIYTHGSPDFTPEIYHNIGK